MTRYTIEHHLPADFADRELRADVRAGLGSTPKSIPPKWFYDKIGSELFEDITRLPEYYPTRAEREILAGCAGQIAAGHDFDTLVELGSGSSQKTRLLLDALAAGRDPVAYLALDVSEPALVGAAEQLADSYPDLRIHAVVADFTHQLHLLAPAAGQTRLVAFLGGTLGNFEPAERAEFLTALRAVLGPRDRFLLGADLVKDPAVLVAAYDDASGVTAAFNRNLLDVLNDRLDAEFDPSSFEHVALWNAEHEWIEMRLRSRRAQTVHLASVDLDVPFGEGEDLLTEISAKFRRPRLQREFAAAGFAIDGWWTDRRDRFSLSLWSAVP